MALDDGPPSLARQILTKEAKHQMKLAGRPAQGNGMVRAGSSRLVRRTQTRGPRPPSPKSARGLGLSARTREHSGADSLDADFFAFLLGFGEVVDARVEQSAQPF